MSDFGFGWGEEGRADGYGGRFGGYNKGALTKEPPRVSCISSIGPVRLCNDASVSRLLCNSPCNLLKDQTALPEGSNTRIPHPSRLTQTQLLHGPSPHAPTTTLRERRERERSAPVHLRRTAHALRWRGRRRANRLVGLPMLLGVCHCCCCCCGCCSA